MPEKDMHIKLINDAEFVSVAADFFIENVDLQYISHGEIMDGRADDASHWNPKLREVIAEDVAEAIANKTPATAVGLHLAAAFDREVLCGLAMFEVVSHRRNCYAVIHDLMVAKAIRNRHVGSQLAQWLDFAFAEDGRIRQVFLESGINNHRAHHFFEGLGFSSCSVVMMKPLG
jgi:ribosomal protein S18 acetylase RimI-like enzyme